MIEFLFQAVGWVPERANAKIVEAAVTLNYTTIPNVIFLVLSAALLTRFFRTDLLEYNPSFTRSMLESKRGLARPVRFERRPANYRIRQSA